MSNVATAPARDKGKIVCLDAHDNEVPAGDPTAVMVRVKGMALLQNGSFKVTRHPSPPPPAMRHCKTRNGVLPAVNHRPASSGDDEAVAKLDAERIEPGLDPPLRNY